MVVVRCIIINSFIGIAARGINCYIVSNAAPQAAAAKLTNRIKNVKKMADAFFFGILRNGIHFYKRNSYKS